MEILVFLCIISQLNLVLTDENVAIDSAVPQKHTYKVRPDPKDLDPQDDQVAESSQPVTQSYGPALLSSNQNGLEDENHIQLPLGQLAHGGLNHVTQQSEIHLQESLRPEDLQSVLSQGYSHQPQQVIVHQYPIQEVQIIDAEAAPLQQVEGSLQPVQGSLQPVQGSLQPVQGSLQPVQGSLQPVQGSLQPVQGSLQPVQGSLQQVRSSLHQVHDNENQKALGYSSYVEHVSQKDEEEINSALKEGSVQDIKRLVPKSEMSFKIYKNGKEGNVENLKSEIQTNLVAQTQQKIVGGYPHQSQQTDQIPQTHQTYPSKLHHRIKSDLQETHIKAAFPEHSTAGLGGLQQTYLKTEIGGQQHAFENSQQLLQSAGKIYSHDQQSVSGQSLYYTLPEVNTQKTFLEINGKTSVVNPHFQISMADTKYNKPTSLVEFNSLNVKGLKQNNEISNLNYKKHWIFDSKAEGSQKSVKTVKPLSTLHIDPVAQTEKIRSVHYSQTHPVSAISHVSQTFNKQKVNSLAETSKKIGGNFLAHSYVTKAAQQSFPGQFPNKAHAELKATHLLNRPTGNYVSAETLKTGQNHIISHLGTTAYGGSQAITGGQGQHFAIHGYSDNEPAKTEHGLVSHVAQSSYTDTKIGQNNFDHQKALEGSTSFDIKNAIDSSGNLLHQTNYVKPATEVHAFENLQKQQLSYVVPKIPAVVLENSIHESPVVETHQIKNFGHAAISSPQLSYHAVSSPDVSGKFFHQPIVWTSEHLKQGSGFTANDLQPSVIKVHLPKEEIYQHVKSPNLPLPSSSVSNIIYHKQPYVIHYDVPTLKYPQEVHLQPKTKFRIHNNQAGHIKLSQPVAIDWSLFKSTLPGIQTLSVKPELTTHIQEAGKKVVPILVRKRKNRSNSLQDVGVVYGKVNNNRRPALPTHRQEKNIHVNLLAEASNNVNKFEPKGERKNEFSVSASYKVDRSLELPKVPREITS